MARQTSAPTTKSPPLPAAKRRASAGGQAQGTAARSRINQRRKQRITRQVRRLEAVLPSANGVIWRPELPQIGSWPGWQLLRARWFMVTVFLLLLLAGFVTWVHVDERWFLYREDVRFSGLHYLDSEELWRLSEIDGWNLFWLDTKGVRQRLMSNPYVADADVYVTPWLGTVNLDITEAQPIALWLTDNGTRWLLPSALALEPRGPTPPGLLEIADGGAVASAPGVALGSAIDADVLASAQSLLAVLPDVAPLRYNRQIGLNFQLQNKPYWVYWGDGSNIVRKLENLAAVEQLLADGTLQGTVIDVRFERPYVK